MYYLIIYSNIILMVWGLVGCSAAVEQGSDPPPDLLTTQVVRETIDQVAITIDGSLNGIPLSNTDYADKVFLDYQGSRNLFIYGGVPHVDQQVSFNVPIVPPPGYKVILSNEEICRVDCKLELHEPSGHTRGNVSVEERFSLENDTTFRKKAIIFRIELVKNRPIIHKLAPLVIIKYFTDKDNEMSAEGRMLGHGSTITNIDAGVYTYGMDTIDLSMQVNVPAGFVLAYGGRDYINEHQPIIALPYSQLVEISGVLQPYQFEFHLFEANVTNNSFRYKFTLTFYNNSN